MKQIGIAISLIIFLFSCDKESVKTSFLDSTDSLKYITIKDTILQNFFLEYIKRNNESKGIFIVQTSSDFVDRKQYVIVKTIADYTTDSIAPLTFTRINSIPVFFSSGIDNFFPSKTRYSHYLVLSKNILVGEFIAVILAKSYSAERNWID